MDHVYRVGQVYRDRAGVKFDDDEFLRWFNYEKTIANAGGVRWRDFLRHDLLSPGTARKIPAYFVLMTVRKRSQYQNPWEDVIAADSIRYWGDAKIDSEKTSYLDFRGNQRFIASSDAATHGMEAIPPILHFTKYEDGWVQFSGLCWLSNMTIETFNEGGREIENLVLSLAILDIPEVSLEWLKERSSSDGLQDANRKAPLVWLEACQGNLRQLSKPTIPYSQAIAERTLREKGTLSSVAEFDPMNLEDGRSKTLSFINQRQGQLAFRRKLMEAYGNCCAVTGCNIIQILEACHIRPYRGHHTNDTRNGLLLRSDIHSLFDLGLLGVDPATFEIVVSQALLGTEYEQFHGIPLRLPAQRDQTPNAKALLQHYSEMNLLSKPHVGNS